MIAARSLSQRLRKPTGSSAYRGVSFHSVSGKWFVSLRVSGKNKYIGIFKTEMEALAAINEANAKYFPDNPDLQQKEYKLESIGLNNIICGKWG